MRVLLTSVILASALLAACVAAPSPGDHEGPIPPRLALQDNTKGWSNIGNFGPVPAAQAELAAQTCAKMDGPDAHFEATGYHAKAQGLNGRTLAGGGFFCVRK
jgi:hypothetical protein